MPRLLGTELWEPSLCRSDPEQMPGLNAKARVEGTLGWRN